MGDGEIVEDKLIVEVGEAKKRVYFLDLHRGQPCSHAIKFDQIRSKLTESHDHSKVFNFRYIELTFFKLQMEVKLSHALENMTGLLSIGFGVGVGDERVIYVDDKPSFCNHVSEGVIHEMLECGRGNIEAEEHDGGFEKSFMSDKGGLPLVTIFDMDVIVTQTNVELGEMVSVF